MLRQISRFKSEPRPLQLCRNAHAVHFYSIVFRQDVTKFSKQVFVIRLKSDHQKKKFK